MKKQWKKIISIGCVACMLTSTMSVTGVTEVLAETIASQSEDDIASGTWGTCKWVIDKDGVMTISGGVGENLLNPRPWNAESDSIKEINITGKITFTEKNLRMEGLFSDLPNLVKIEGLGNFDTKNVANMRRMFYGCEKLEELDVSNWDVHNVTNMSGMFCYCESLKEVDVSNWDVSNVTTMANMFYECGELRKLDFSNWDMSNVVVTMDMFGQNNITEIIAPKAFDKEGNFVSYMDDSLELGQWKDVTANISYEIKPDVIKAGHHYICENTDVTVSGKWGNCDWTWKNRTIVLNGGVAESLQEIDYENNYEDIEKCLWTSGDAFLRAVDIEKIKITGNITFEEDKVNLGRLFNGLYKLEEITGLNYIDTSKVTDMSSMFRYCESLQEVDISDWNFKNVTNMNGMFAICTKLKELDVSDWEVEKVTNMSNMFSSCEELEKIDVSNWNVENVTDISYMFMGCEKLEEIDVSNWKTGNVTNTSGAFSSCTNLEEIDVSAWDMENVTNAAAMFSYCKNLRNVDVKNWNAINISMAAGMFQECEKIRTLEMGNWDVSKMSIMFGIFNTMQLKKVVLPKEMGAQKSTFLSNISEGMKEGVWYDVTADIEYANKSEIVFEAGHEYVLHASDDIASGTWGTCKWVIDKDGVMTISGGVATSIERKALNAWDIDYLVPWAEKRGAIVEIDITGKITFEEENVSLAGLFAGHSKLTKILGLKKLDTSKVADMFYMFGGCHSLESLDVSRFDTSQVKDMSLMFYDCSSLENLDVSGFDTSKVTDMSAMFRWCNSLKNLDVSRFDTSKVTDMSDMFYDCSSLENLDVSKFNTSKVTNMSCMFTGCGLESLDVSKFDTSQVTNMSWMFEGCSSLESLDVSRFDTSKVTDMSYMFCWCNSLKYLDVSRFDTSEVTNMSYMFTGCGLESLDVSRFDTSKVTDMSWMFDDCFSLKSPDVSGFDTNQVTNMSHMFYGCSSLESLDVSRFDTSKVTDMSWMFGGCFSLKSLDVSGFDTNQVTSMSYMFYGCRSLESLNFSKFNTSQVSDMSTIFFDTRLNRIIMPKEMGDNASEFTSELRYSMKNGIWYDLTSDIEYATKDDIVFEAGHEYVSQVFFETKKDDETGIILKKEDGTLFDTDLRFNVSEVTESKAYLDYIKVADELGDKNQLFDISLEKDGVTVQPDGNIIVTIPLPQGMNKNSKVYHIAEDGTATDMNATYEEGILTFVTDHFSVYAVIGGLGITGDVDGDGKVTFKDSTLLRRYLAGWEVELDESMADVDGDGKVTFKDSTLLRRYLAGWEVEFK